MSMNPTAPATVTAPTTVQFQATSAGQRETMRVAGRGRLAAARPVSFTFDGQKLTGREGDTLASALLANGIHLIGRSFKYHRPRGILSAGCEEPNALVGTTRGPGRFEPNTRATIAEVFEGFRANSQNRWPSLRFDVGAVNDSLYMLFSAGFYYKTFMWPKSFWNKVYEPVIRGAAGLGAPPTEVDPDTYASRFAHCDVLVVGAGAAGIAAALSASESGAKVVLVDEQAEAGGWLLSEPGTAIGGKPSWDWLREALATLEARPNVTVLTRTTAFGYYHQNFVGLCQRLTDHQAKVADGTPRERMWKVRAKQVVLAQGAIEKPLVFSGNDRPGVMLAGAGRTYLNRYGVRVGNEAVVVTSHDSAWGAAFDLASSGTRVSLIVDTRRSVDPTLVAEARALGIETLLGGTVTGTKGRLRVSSVCVGPVDASGKVGATRWVSCDVVLMSGGWTPSLHLFSHTGGKLVWDEAAQTFLPGQATEACRVAGAGAGQTGLDAALANGSAAGAAAATDAGKAATATTYAVAGERPLTGESCNDLPTDRDPSFAKAFVDFQNDVLAKDIKLAVREGFRSVEHIKRYTTNGMATDQGKDVQHQRVAHRRQGPRFGSAEGRPHDLPPALHADDLRRLRRLQPGLAVRRDAQDADRQLVGSARRRLRAGRPVAPRPLLPEGGRGHARGGEPRVQADARQRRHVRRLDPRQDRGRGPGRGDLHEPHVHQRLDEARAGRCRYGLLLGEDGFIRDDGVIGRSRTTASTSPRRRAAPRACST